MLDYAHMSYKEIMHYGSLHADTPLEKALVKLALHLEEEVAHLENQLENVDACDHC